MIFPHMHVIPRKLILWGHTSQVTRPNICFYYSSILSLQIWVLYLIIAFMNQIIHIRCTIEAKFLIKEQGFLTMGKLWSTCLILTYNMMIYISVDFCMKLMWYALRHCVLSYFIIFIFILFLYFIFGPICVGVVHTNFVPQPLLSQAQLAQSITISSSHYFQPKLFYLQPKSKHLYYSLFSKVTYKFPIRTFIFSKVIYHLHQIFLHLQDSI